MEYVAHETSPSTCEGGKPFFSIAKLRGPPQTITLSPPHPPFSSSPSVLVHSPPSLLPANLADLPVLFCLCCFCPLIPSAS